MTDANGCPGCLRESVARAPLRARYARVRARSAYVGSGTGGDSPRGGGPAWRLTGSIPRGGERADLVVGAAAAGAPRRRGVEAARANASSGRLDGVDRLLEVGGSRCVTAYDVRVDEAQLQTLR